MRHFFNDLHLLVPAAWTAITIGAMWLVGRLASSFVAGRLARAEQDPLSSLFAGILMTMSGQVRIGDFVRLDSGLEGRLTDFNWRSTSLAVGSGSTAVVPSAKLAQAIVTNFDLPSREVNVPVDISRGHRAFGQRGIPHPK